MHLLVARVGQRQLWVEEEQGERGAAVHGVSVLLQHVLQDGRVQERALPAGDDAVHGHRQLAAREMASGRTHGPH